MKRIVLIGILLMLASTLFVFGGPPNIPEKSTQNNQNEKYINLAKQRYQVVKNAKLDLITGPCMGPIDNDWVADLVHSPRQSIDDDESNQCPDYISGTVHHFVELDLDGNFIRAK